VFDTKVAILVLDDLPVWQKPNVTASAERGRRPPRGNPRHCLGVERPHHRYSKAAARNKCFHPDRRLAVRDIANGPLYLIAASFVGYFVIHDEMTFTLLENFWRGDRFRAEFPARQI
jgi:hypothetical protein